jgi:putative sugar O-methyltransferase
MTQVKDEPELLRSMLKDSASVPAVYKTTNYWSIKERALVPEIEKIGLKDFRRRSKSYLTSFGAADAPISLGKFQLYNSPVWNSNLLRKIPLWSRVLAAFNIILNRISPTFLPIHSEITVSDIQNVSYEFTRLYGIQQGAKPVSDVCDSMVGNPADAFSIEGRNYTTGLLSYYMRYAYLCKFINFNSMKVIVELGSGSGRQIEVLKKLYPDICFFLFDIPPQLYVCEQYLKSVFPDSVVSYEKTRTMNSIAIGKGKIFIMGNWKFPLIEKVTVDLFWNAASFQEMEPDVVANYLQYVNSSAKNVYLQELMDGQVQAKSQGLKGVLRRTTLENYRSGLTRFQMVDLSPCWTPMGIIRGCSDSFWESK